MFETIIEFLKRFDEIVKFSFAISPIVLGLMQVLKSLKKGKKQLIGKDWLPAVSLVVGTLVSLLFFGIDVHSLQIGLISALIASGLYDVKKPVLATYNLVKKAIIKK